MHELFMQRAFDLARLGIGQVSPNPAVGAVLVHQNRIIGEGYHQAYGKAHAEVNAVAAVVDRDRSLIPYSTLYVTLEPCNIHGNTPPCTDLILRERIPRVVISQIDKTDGVNGSGISRLREAGVEVIEGMLAQQGSAFSQLRNVFVREKRPYIVLKWAQTQNGFFAPLDRSSFWITNSYTNRLVHKWRGETDAILVGTTTAAHDNPSLTTRHYPGKNPLRLVVDRQGRLPHGLQLFDGKHPTWVFQQSLLNKHQAELVKNVQLDFEDHWAKALLDHLYQHKVAHLTIEGGVQLLQHFIDSQLWDEARVLMGKKELLDGIRAPLLPVRAKDIFQIGDDQLRMYER